MDVSTGKNIDSKGTASHTEDKLARLLETERELEEMLMETKREAAELVETARALAQRRVGQLESRLEAEKASIRTQIARERDEQVASIKAAAKAQTARLDDLSDDVISTLADHVVRLLVGTEEPGGRH